MDNELEWRKPRQRIEVDLKPQEKQEIDLVDQEVVLATPEISLETHKDS